MSIVKSLGVKLKGKRINRAVKTAESFGEYLPLEDDVKLVDKAHVDIIRMKSDGGLLGVTVPKKCVSVSHMIDVFNDKETYDASVDDNFLYLTVGKNIYRFPLIEDDSSPVKIPEIECNTEFTFKPKELVKATHGKGLKKGHTTIRTIWDKKGKKSVWAILYDEGGTVPQSYIKLTDDWYDDKGLKRRVMLPTDYLRKLDNLGDEIHIEMDDDYPIAATSVADGIEMRYLLAPRIENDDSEEFIAKQKEITRVEDEYIASHNMRRCRKLPWKKTGFNKLQGRRRLLR